MYTRNPYINKQMFIDLALTDEQEIMVRRMLDMTITMYKRMFNICLERYKLYNDINKLLTTDYFMKDIKNCERSLYLEGMDIDFEFLAKYCKKTVSYNVNRARDDVIECITNAKNGSMIDIPKFIKDYAEGTCYYLYLVGNTTNAQTGMKFGFIKDKLIVETYELGKVGNNKNPNNVAMFKSIPQCSCVRNLRIICRNFDKGKPLSRYTLTFVPSFVDNYGTMVK